MPPISPTRLVNEIIDAIHQSGGVSAYISDSVRTHPRKFEVAYQGNTFSIWIYIWTLTHGGRPSLPNEYRIQMTSVSSPLEINPDGITVLVGYHPDLKVFSGFDLSYHNIFTAGSPSVQIDIRALHEALQNGLSFTTKENDEIAIGVRPDQFLTYCINSQALHSCGNDNTLINTLSRVAQREVVPQQDIANLVADRRRIVSLVNRTSRDANFSKSVKNAYDNRCAITRVQLKLIDAAHILPVPSGESSDHVTNGIALSPTYHRAYDNCLIYLDEDFVMKLNTEKVDHLRSLNLDDGLDQFSSFLDRRIHLPLDINQRPRVEYIRLANKHRRIPGYF